MFARSHAPRGNAARTAPRCYGARAPSGNGTTLKPSATQRRRSRGVTRLLDADMPSKPRLYLDNCCFNRPYDNQEQLKIYLETQAKLAIQEQIITGKYELIWSYILEYENA